ncbi:MAG: hypothetical protein WBR33_11020 [Pseudonocardiaceae bacterium]
MAVARLRSIATDQDLATLINVFTVTRMTQQPLVDLLVEATEQVMRHRPGFIGQHPRQPRRHPGRQLCPVAQPGGLPGDAR